MGSLGNDFEEKIIMNTPLRSARTLELWEGAKAAADPHKTARVASFIVIILRDKRK